MLEAVLQSIHNWFEVGIHPGTYTIEGGSLELPFLQEGQYFRIIGSVFNDGLHQYPAELKNETFTGTVWALAVPKAVEELAKNVSDWQNINGNPGPYSSESFGGYSYTRATNSQGQAATWKDAFRAQLNRWRKI